MCIYINLARIITLESDVVRNSFHAGFSNRDLHDRPFLLGRVLKKSVK